MRCDLTWLSKSPCFQILANNRDGGILVLLETCCRITRTFPYLKIYQSTLSLKQPEYTVLDKYQTILYNISDHHGQNSYTNLNMKVSTKECKRVYLKILFGLGGGGGGQAFMGGYPLRPPLPPILPAVTTTIRQKLHQTI